MLSLPDFREKQLLFIQTERGVSNKIRFRNDNIVFEKGGEVVNRASCHKVFAVFVIGDLAITSQLMKNGVEHGISFFFLKPNMEVYTSINAASEANYLLKGEQYSMTSERELAIAKCIVENKIKNQEMLLRSVQKTDEAARLGELTVSITLTENHDSLRGIEGNASKLFFSNYFEALDWVRRAPRAKPDKANFLLDIGYTILFNCVDSLLRLYGFDTYKGCYHKLFFQRKSLSCDIVEPFRCVVDKQLRKSFNLGQIKGEDFSKKNGKVSAKSFKESVKYSTLFMEMIMAHKDDLYLFVQGFYRHVMNPDKNPFPTFIIK